MPSRSPFPGMDPWLEGLWGDVHHSIIQYARDQINGQLPLDLYARIEETMYIVAPGTAPTTARPDVALIKRQGGGRSPSAGDEAAAAAADGSRGSVAVAEPVRVLLADDPVTLGHIEIRLASRNEALVTAIEVISPTNKLDRRARRQYRLKRRAYHAADANVVEIDLLRAGRPLIDVPLAVVASDSVLRAPYKCCIRRAGQRDEVWVDYYPFHLRERLPRIRVPLRPMKNESVILDLQEVIDLAYERGRYGVQIDYKKIPDPPLSPDDAAWAAELVRQRK